MARKKGKKKEKWMQEVNAAMEAKGTKGAFTRYCKRLGYKGVTEACIQKGLKSKNPTVRRRARLAKIFREIAKKRKKKRG